MTGQDVQCTLQVGLAFQWTAAIAADDAEVEQGFGDCKAVLAVAALGQFEGLPQVFVGFVEATLRSEDFAEVVVQVGRDHRVVGELLVDALERILECFVDTDRAAAVATQQVGLLEHGENEGRRTFRALRLSARRGSLAVGALGFDRFRLRGGLGDARLP